MKFSHALQRDLTRAAVILGVLSGATLATVPLATRVPPTWWGWTVAVGISSALVFVRSVIMRVLQQRLRPRLFRELTASTFGAHATGSDAQADRVFWAGALIDRLYTQDAPNVAGAAIALLVSAALLTMRFGVATGAAVLLAALTVVFSHRGLGRRLDAVADATAARRNDAAALVSAAARDAGEIAGGAARDAYLASVESATSRWAQSEARWEVARRGRQTFAVASGAVVFAIVIAVLQTGFAWRAATLSVAHIAVLAVLLAPVLQLIRAASSLRGVASEARAYRFEPAAEHVWNVPMPLDADAIRLTQVGIRFGAHVVVDDLDVVIAARQLTAIVGPNGSGKTTLLRAIAGLSKLSEGSVMVGDAALDSVRREDVAFVPHTPLMIDALSVADNVRLVVPDADDAEIAGALQRWDVRCDVALRVLALSRGEKQRVALARALLRPRPLVVLDEPDTNLDTEGRTLLTTRLTELATRATVVVATHDASFAECCDDIVRLGNSSAATDIVGDSRVRERVRAGRGAA